MHQPGRISAAQAIPLIPRRPRWTAAVPSFELPSRVSMRAMITVQVIGLAVSPNPGTRARWSKQSCAPGNPLNG